MIVVTTILNGRPVKNRALNRPADIRRTLRPPSGTNLKFLVLFSTQPIRAGFIKTSQAIAKERVNKITKQPINQ